MYYKLIRYDENNEPYLWDIVSIKNINAYLRCEEEFDLVELIRPRTVEIIPQSMRQYGWKHQSFEFETTTGETVTFFNVDEFKVLHQIFEHRKLVIYKQGRGPEIRDYVIATIDSNGVEHRCKNNYR